MNARGASLIAIVALALSACGGKPPPAKVDAEAEKAAALERARHDAFGTQVQALDKAKGMEADLNKKAEDNLKKADEASK
ncbi:MAG TPA: hypothetical protein VGI57_15190 [Usitatibacter sp.]|jgi:hypothetical protein